MMQPKIDAINVMKNITITVKIKRFTEAKIRLWIGMQLIKLAALVMNMNVEIEEDGNNGDICDC
jgi:hypothetical protein